MKTIRIPFGLIVLAAFLLPAVASAAIITDHVVAHTTPNNAPRALMHAGKRSFSYYDAHNQLLLDRLGSSGPVVVVAHDAAAANSYNGSFSQQGNLYFIWRPKLKVATKGGGRPGDKHLMFRASYDNGKSFSKPVRLDSGNGAFHPRPLISSGTNNLYLTWLDERDGGSSYGVFLNLSTDQGHHWLKHDIRMSQKGVQALDPFMAVDQENLWVGWTEINPKTHTMIMKLRSSINGGKKWATEVTIPAPKGQVISPGIVKTKDALLVFYYIQEYGLLLSRSLDNGGHWQTPVILPGTKDWASNGFKIASDPLGDVCLAWTGPAKLGKVLKSDVYASCTHDAGKKWDPVHRLDTNAPNFSHSLVPDIAMDVKGNVIVVWQDSRKIRPHIYLNYSTDGGRSWLRQDMDLHNTGRHFSQYPDLFSLGSGKFLIAWEEQKGDSPEGKSLLAYEEVGLGKCLQLGIGKPEKICPQKSIANQVSDDRKKRLLSREQMFWNFYVNREFEKAFAMFDPFARQRLDKRTFVNNIGRFLFLQAKLTGEEAEIIENRGKVKIKVTVDAPNLGFSHGKKMAMERTERTLNESWIWIDGDWFKVYEHSNGDFLPL